MNDQLEDGWYKVTDTIGNKPVEYHQIVDGCLDYGYLVFASGGATVAEVTSWGWQLEPAVVMTRTEYDDLQIRIATLQQERDEWRATVNELDNSLMLATCAVDELRAQVIERDAAQVELQPDWSQAPEWAQWWTRDLRGYSIWWETKPFYDGQPGIWMNEDDTRREFASGAPIIQRRTRGDEVQP